MKSKGLGRMRDPVHLRRARVRAPDRVSAVNSGPFRGVGSNEGSTGLRLNSKGALDLGRARVRALDSVSAVNSEPSRGRRFSTARWVGVEGCPRPQEWHHVRVGVAANERDTPRRAKWRAVPLVARATA